MNFSVFHESILWAEKHSVPIWKSSKTTSTNDISKKNLLEKKEFCLFLANEQTQGRGRRNARWLNANSGDALLSTWRFFSKEKPQHLTGPIVGWGLWKAAQRTWKDSQWSLKPPNDLYLNQKKVAGLLNEVESHGEGFFLSLGLGMNVFSYPENLPHAGSLKDCGILISKEDWNEFLNHLLNFWKEGLKKVTKETMEARISQELKDALNKNPLRKRDVLEIKNNGDLITQKETISWRTL